MNLTHKLCYSFTPNALQEIFTDFLQEKYGYTPELTVHFDTEIWLPIVVEIEEKNEEDFLNFWNRFQRDIFSLKDKHSGDEFELGDKIFQLLLGKDTESYSFDKFQTKHAEYVYGDDAVVHIFVEPDASLSFQDEETLQEKITDLEERMSPFIFKEEDFDTLQTEYATLLQTEISTELGYISLLFSYENDQQFATIINFRRIEHLRVEIITHGFCPSFQMSQDAQNIAKRVEALCKEKLKHLSPSYQTTDKTIVGLRLPITYFKGLTRKENVVLSLYKIHGLSFAEICSLLQEEHIVVDNTMYRIQRKYIEDCLSQDVQKQLENFLEN